MQCDSRIPDNRPLRIIEPGRSAGAQGGLAEIVAYRELFQTLVWRSINTRYRQMALGVAWVMLEPLTQMIIISVFFGMLFRLPSDGIPYPVFVLSALLPWSFFSRVVQDSANSLRDNMSLISKVYFPRILLPFVSVAKVLVDTGVTLILLLAVMMIFGFFPKPQFLLMPFFLLLAMILGMGIGMIASVIIVRYRDITYLINLALQVWMYLTPIVYSPSIVPESLRPLYEINPTYWVVGGFRWCLLDKPIDFNWRFTAAWAVALGVLATGAAIFNGFQQKTVDYE